MLLVIVWTHPLQTHSHSRYLSCPPSRSTVAHRLNQDNHIPHRPTLAEPGFLSPGSITGNHQIPIDPVLLANEHSQSLGANPVPEVNDLEVEGENSDAEDADFDGVGKKRGQRLTLREKAEKYGLVEGVMRGNTIYSTLLRLSPEARAYF
jgi:hypothetical protein